MKKVIKVLTLMFSLIFIFVLASCKNDITGTLEVTTTSTKITAKASFNKNAILEEKTTIVTVKLYDKDVTSQLDRKTVTLSEGVEGSVSFEDLDSDTSFVLKLYVSYAGTETLICEKEAKTTSSGSSEDKPIEISSVAEFLNIEDDTDAYYKLTADLDFKDQTNISLCSSSEPFEGVLDGNGHKISNYVIASGEYAGLFEYVEDATIKNLKLENVSTEITSTFKYVGALAGYAVNTEIKDVTLDGFNVTTSSGPTTTAQFGGLVGVITSESNSKDDSNTSSISTSDVLNINLDLAQVRPSTNYIFYGGGFAGRISGSTSVSNCSSDGILNIKSRSSSGTAYIGGFAGAIESSQVVSGVESYVSISIVRASNTFGRLCVGGIAGSNGLGQINLDNCLAVCDIEAINDEARTSETYNLASKAYIGGIVGDVEFSQKGVKNCYYAKALNGISVKQADSTQQTNYVADCFVSETIAKVASVAAGKVTNVYTYDSALNVVGMTEKAETPNQTAYNEILSSDLQVSLLEAIKVRDVLKTEVGKFDIDTYSYTKAYKENKEIEFAAGVTTSAVDGSYVLDNNKLTIDASSTTKNITVKFSVADATAPLVNLNVIVHVVIA